jgi:hypothetical protein
MPTIKIEPSSTDHPAPTTSPRPFSLFASTPASSNITPDPKQPQRSSKLSKSRNGCFLSVTERNAQFANQIGLKRGADDATPSSINPEHPASKKSKTLSSLPSRATSPKPTAKPNDNVLFLSLLDLLAPYMTFQIALASLSSSSKRTAQRAAGRVQRVVEKLGSGIDEISNDEEDSATDTDDNGASEEDSKPEDEYDPESNKMGESEDEDVSR